MKLRRLTAWEAALARSVFGRALDPLRVRLLFHDAASPPAVTLGCLIVMPRPYTPDFAAETSELQAWLIHELTHALQFQTAPWRSVGSWARVLLAGGYGPGLPGYRYALPAAWAALNLEQQAAAVEDAFRLRHGLPMRFGPSGARLSDYAGLIPFPITENP